MGNLSLTGKDIDALSRVAQDEMGGWQGYDRYNGARAVVDTAVNRTASGAYKTQGDLQTGLNAPAQYTGVMRKANGDWSNLPEAPDDIRGIVADRLRELSYGVPTRQFTDFANPAISEGSTNRAWARALAADPASQVIGRSPNSMAFGNRPGNPLARGFAVSLDPTAEATVGNWENVDQDSMTEKAAMSREAARQQAIRDALLPDDFGFHIPAADDLTPQAMSPVAPVEYGGPLSDITPMGADYGVPLSAPQEPDTIHGMYSTDELAGGTKHQLGLSYDDLSTPSFEPPVGPYDFGGLRSAIDAVQPLDGTYDTRSYAGDQLGDTARNDPAYGPAMGVFGPTPQMGFVDANYEKPAAAPEVTSTSFGMGFTPQTPAMNDIGLGLSDRYKSMDITPEAPTTLGDYSQEGGFQPTKLSNDWSREEAPTEEKAPTTERPDFGMNVSPTSFSGMKTTSMAPATSLAQALEPSYTPSYDGSTVPASPTADQYGTPPDQKPVAMQRAPSFVDNPYMSMPTAASFAPAAYATATKATQAPQQPAQPQFSQWGQENNVTGNWAQDTSPAASNARISGLGAYTMDPLTGRMMETGNQPDRPDGYHEMSQAEVNGWGMGGGNLGGGNVDTGGLW